MTATRVTQVGPIRTGMSGTASTPEKPCPHGLGRAWASQAALPKAPPQLPFLGADWLEVNIVLLRMAVSRPPAQGIVGTDGFLEGHPKSQWSLFDRSWPKRARQSLTAAETSTSPFLSHSPPPTSFQYPLLWKALRSKRNVTGPSCRLPNEESA